MELCQRLASLACAMFSDELPHPKRSAGLIAGNLPEVAGVKLDPAVCQKAAWCVTNASLHPFPTESLRSGYLKTVELSRGWNLGDTAIGFSKHITCRLLAIPACLRLENEARLVHWL
jgi:hypothetical protein